MDFLTKVLAAMLGRFLADDLRAWCPSLANGLIDLAVRRLPQDLRERYAEEWQAHIAETPGEIGKLVCAIGILWAGWRVWQTLRIDRLRHLSETFPGIMGLAIRALTTCSILLFAYELVRFKGKPLPILILMLAGVSLTSVVLAARFLWQNSKKANTTFGREKWLKWASETEVFTEAEKTLRNSFEDIGRITFFECISCTQYHPTEANFVTLEYRLVAQPVVEPRSRLHNTFWGIAGEGPVAWHDMVEKPFQVIVSARTESGSLKEWRLEKIVPLNSLDIFDAEVRDYLESKGLPS